VIVRALFFAMLFVLLAFSIYARLLWDWPPLHEKCDHAISDDARGGRSFG
jgi:hypothetical protein